MLNNLDMNFDFEFGLTYNSLDFNLIGESLDFVPLPTLDASLVQGDVDSISQLQPQALHPSTRTASTSKRDKTAAETTESAVNMDASYSFNSWQAATCNPASSANVVINPQNHHLVQHYLDVMTGYAKVNDNNKQHSNNLFISAFTKSLHFLPLFHAILAFSASHMAMDDPSYLEQAANLSRLAGESFAAFRHADNLEAEGLLSALFVRVKTIHMLAGNVDSFLELMAAAADIVRTMRDDDDKISSLSPSSNSGGISGKGKEFQSPSTRRVILRLAILDGRACFHRLGGGKLVNLLRDIPAFSLLFARNLPSAAEADDFYLVSLLRADILRIKVADLDIALRKQQEAEIVSRAPVRVHQVQDICDDIQYEIGQWNAAGSHKDIASINPMPRQRLTEDRVLSATEYGYYIVQSALHSALLYLYTIYVYTLSLRPPDGQNFPRHANAVGDIKPLSSIDASQSVAAVMGIQLKISHDPSRAASPSSVLPSSLFMAALATSDPVHVQWILHLFRAASKWGIYIRKGQELLEEMLRQPPGADVCDVMDRVTGKFII